jgi:hypothetical protein
MSGVDYPLPDSLALRFWNGKHSIKYVTGDGYPGKVLYASATSYPHHGDGFRVSRAH